MNKKYELAVNLQQDFTAEEQAQGRANIGAASASDVTALQSQVSSLSNVSAYTVKGEATVAQLNAGPSGIQAGWAYQLKDSGTLTEGSLAVVAGDTVAWDGTKWFPLVKSDYYATKTYAENVAKSIAPAFDPTKPNDAGGYAYYADEIVTYNGAAYRFKANHPSGDWTGVDADVTDISDLIDKYCIQYDIVQNDSSVFSNEGFILDTGRVSLQPGWFYTDYIDISEALSIDARAAFSNEYGGGIAFYDSAKSYISSIYNTSGDNKVVDKADFPARAAFIRVTTSQALLSSSFVNLKKLSSEIVNYFDSCNRSEEIFKYSDYDNDSFSFTDEFIENNGTITNSPGYNCTDFIDISNALTIEATASFNNSYGGGIAFYDGGHRYISSLYNVPGLTTYGSFDNSVIPSNAKFIRVTSPYRSVGYVSIKLIDEHFVKAVLGDTEFLSNGDYSKYAESLDDGETLEITNPCAKNGFKISLSCQVGETVGTIVVSQGAGLYNTAKVEVDDTYIKVYSPNSSGRVAQSFAHGLTITSMIELLVNVDEPNNTATLSLMTLGGSFSQDCNWGGNVFPITASVIGASLANVTLTYCGHSFLSSVWLFGDSYFDFINSKFVQLGCTDYLLCGRSGESSQGGFNSFIRALKIAKPKIVVWCLGMNDSDSSTAINSGYKTAFDSVRYRCEELGVKLVVCTIPNVPARNHTYKNSYIRSSGADVIDVASVLGANDIGSSWYEGLLSGDNVHPTSAGVAIIANLLKNSLPI